MKFHQFFEARREVKEAKRRGKTIPIRPSDFDELEKYKDKDDVFISFRSIDKIGINPKSVYNTPNGIYTYPLKEVYNNNFKLDKKQIDVPFAGFEPYIFVIKKQGRGIDDLYLYSSKDFDDDMDKLRKEFGDNEVDKNIARGRQAFVKNPGGIMWHVTRELANKKPVKWTKILNKTLGYDYVIDRSGQGIIHQSEPTQAVFFSTKAFKILDKVVQNKYRKGIYGNDVMPKWFKKAKTENPKIKIYQGRFIWEGGTWNDGTWEGQEWENGFWDDGVWKHGEWSNGVWENGVWKKGKWRSGVWRDGVWENGVFVRGSFMGGTWKDGDFHSGDFFYSTWESGNWYGGKWKKSEWKGGEWKNGWIFDEKREGNFKDGWEWENNFVYSPISPAEYFKKN